MQDPLSARSILKSYGVTPKKKLGQNFIIKKAALDQIIAAAALEQREQILEIGAGLGALTLELAKNNHNVIAIEYDRRLIPILNDILGSYEKVRVVHGDFLKLDIKELIASPSYLVVANIPYQITSAVIRHLVESPIPARKVVLTIQKEVAERVVAQPGNLSLLALSVQIFGEPAIHSHISSRAFYPQPNVESSVLKIEMFPQSKIPVSDLDQFFRIAKVGFSQKRKKLRNALAGGLHLSTRDVEEMMRAASVPPSRRAQELAIEEWQRLSERCRGVL
jgi:16S rRNA (adenine1518-N6/adenine1519-N6)-dimethyltransferase